MSSLSVLCPTRDPGPQVRAALEPLREVADEILIAVDSRAGVGLYRDGAHLSVAGALLLTDRFTRLIAAHARRDEPHRR